MNDSVETEEVEGSEAPAEPAADLAEPLRGAVIEAVGRSSPLLKSALASSLPWRVEESRIVIPFRSGMDESVVRGSIGDIAAKASELAGRPLRIELKVEAVQARVAGRTAHRSEAEGPDPVAVVERVFRGTRLPESAKGERDEHR